MLTAAVLLEHLFDLGITTGCNPPVNNMYCPAENIPRQQMAAFLIRTFAP